MKAYIYAAIMAVFLAGCSSGNNQAPTKAGETQNAAAAKKVATSLGRAAFQKTYISARGWAADATPYNEQSQPTADATGADGASAVWSAGFGSASRGLAKTFTWSGADGSITPSAEDTFNPGNSSTHTFDLGFLKVESDEAYKIAQEHGGKKLTDKDSKIPISYYLGWSPHDNVLEWHLSYGDPPKLRVAINATTHQFIRVEK